MSSLLEVNNLTICFNSKKFIAVDGISFRVAAGQIVGIAGESGSGKSVTALSLLGLLDKKKVVYGAGSSIKFDGQEVVNTDENLLRDLRGGKIGLIFQEPMSSLNPLHRIGRQIAENLVIHQKISYKKALKEAVNLLKVTGIRNARQRARAFPFELSGGQRQRVMIAMAIANNPKLLIADEPTTALDVTIQTQIIDLLLDLRKKTGMAIIFISHDLNLLRKIADYICVMKDGKIVEQGSVSQIFEHPQHVYTKTLISSSIPLKINHNKLSHTVLSGRHIHVSYPLKKNIFGKVIKYIQAVNDVSLELFQGECLGIVGESGSGKTTLGMALAGLIPFRGQVFFKNIYLNQYSNKEIRKKIQIVFQDPYNSLNPRMNIFEIVAEGISVHFPGLNKVEKKEKVIKALTDVGLPADIIDKYPHEFSGGQRQRIAIARALVIEPEVLILDEPTSALDVTIQKQVLELLVMLKNKYNLSYIFISHDMHVIKSLADKVAIMKDGCLVEQGWAEQIFDCPQTDYAQALIQAAF